MTTTIKAIILTLLLSAAAFAQTGPFKPAEVSGMISFYEWALEAKFTPEQRAEFQGYLEDDYRRNGKVARDNANNILSTWAKLRRESKDVQDLTRAELMKEYLGTLRSSNDPDSVFLLGIYEAAHGGGEVETGAPRIDNNSGSTGNLTGKWWRSTGAGRADDGTGKTRYGSGTMYTFEFFNNGTVEYVSKMEALSITQCTIKETSTARGKVTVKGGSMTIDFGPTTTIGSNSCNAKGNFKKTAAASSLTVQFTVKREDSVFRPDAPWMLCFAGTGGEVCHEKDIPFRAGN